MSKIDSSSAIAGINEGYPLDKIDLVPSFDLNEKDFQDKQLTCIGNWHRISYTINEEHKKDLRFLFKDFDHIFSFNTKIKNCNDSNCLIPPESTDKKCQMEELYESFNFKELDDMFFLFSRSCYFYQLLIGIKYEGGFRYQEKKDYNLLFYYFKIKEGTNITDFTKVKSHPCLEQCNNFFDDLTQHCKYIDPYDNDINIFIFVGVASSLFIVSILVLVFYYYSPM